MLKIWVKYFRGHSLLIRLGLRRTGLLWILRIRGIYGLPSGLHGEEWAIWWPHWILTGNPTYFVIECWIHETEDKIWEMKIGQWPISKDQLPKFLHQSNVLLTLSTSQGWISQFQLLFAWTTLIGDCVISTFSTTPQTQCGRLDCIWFRWCFVMYVSRKL